MRRQCHHPAYGSASMRRQCHHQAYGSACLRRQSHGTTSAAGDIEDAVLLQDALLYQSVNEDEAIAATLNELRLQVVQKLCHEIAPDKVRKALQELVDDGCLYTTIDEYHYGPADL